MRDEDTGIRVLEIPYGFTKGVAVDLCRLLGHLERYEVVVRLFIGTSFKYATKLCIRSCSAQGLLASSSPKEKDSAVAASTLSVKDVSGRPLFTLLTIRRHSLFDSFFPSSESILALPKQLSLYSSTR